MANFITPVKNPGGLTNDQYKAAQLIDAWYKGKDPIFTLYGAAGTGKTFLLNYLLQHTFINSTCVTAPTHKAVKVIEAVTGRKGKTLQSLHGLRPNINLDDFDVDKIKFATLGNDTIKNYAAIIIDEGSQVGHALHTLNLKRAIEYNVKILYIGDIAQTPPIKEHLSNIFTVAHKFELMEVVRQEISNPLLTLFGYLREDVVHGGSRCLNYLKNVPTQINSKGEGYMCVDLPTFEREIVNVFSSKEFEANPQNYVRYAAWTNASVNIWNNFIRHQTVLAHDDVISVEDLIVGYKTIVDEFNNPIIINSEDYIIEEITRRMSDDGFAVFVVSFRSLLDGRSVTAFVVDHKHETFSVYVNILTQLRYSALFSSAASRGKTWKAYFSYKEKFLTLVPISIQDDKNKVTYIPKDLDYGYGLTVHKLQGSTITHAFVNLLDICYYSGDKDCPIVNTNSNPHAISLRNKLLYTALSRAKKVAIILV